jgi:tetratricopeptide (TPR) repeat protein
VLSKLRRLAETTAQGSFGIETITKVGYRIVETTQERPLGAQVEDVEKRTRLDRRQLLAGGGALALLGAGGAAWWLIPRGNEAPPAAAEYYRRGVAALREGLPDNQAQAIGFLRQAVAEAPDFAEGWGQLALAYETSSYFLPPEAAQGARVRARSAIRRALDLDPDNASAHAALALAIPTLGNWLAAETAVRKVLELDSTQFDARLMLTHLLSGVGRTREAIANLEPIADQIAMLPLMQFRQAVLLWSAGRLDESDRVIDRARSLWPRNYTVWFSRFWLYVHTGRAREALTLSADQAGRPLGIPDWNFALNELAAQAFVSRDAADIERAVAAHRKAAASGAGFAENAIQILSSFGRLDQAFEIANAYYLGRGFSVGLSRFSPQQGAYTSPNRRFTAFLFLPSTAALRRDPRFATLAEDVKLAAYWRRSGTQPDDAGDMRLPRL